MMRIGIAAALLAGCAAPAQAQEEGAGGRTVYQGGYFSQFSPSNALELVQRVPGFTLEVGSQEVRGFGQAAGNVVINGQRPSAKSDTLETVLARIPASRVARVEVGPGDLFGSEFSGKPQVLNLILTSGGGLAGTLNATLRRDHSGQITPEGNVSALYRRGKSSFNVSAGYNNAHFPEEGTDTITALPSGNLVEFRRKYNDTSDREAFLSGSWEHNGGANRTAHANFRVADGRFALFQTNNVLPVGGTERDDRLSQEQDRRDYEIGGDITRPLLGGGLKLIGLATRRHRLNADTSFNRIGDDLLGGFIQNTESQRNETVARLVWSRSGWNGWSVETGAEAVLNSLDSNVNLFAVDTNGGLSRIDLPVDQAKVTEYRGEAFVNAGRALSPTLRMDLGLTFESSRLTVTGDTESERSLHFLKPKLVLDWKPKGPWHLQLALQRTVAQLNFEDFISSAELANDRVDAGNADLLPQRAWEALLTVERTILGEGLAKAEFGYNRISLLQDRVPTPEGFDAPGNLGTGTQKFVRGTLDVPLAGLGIKGGRLTLNGMLQDTSVEDPYTLQQRRFSGVPNYRFDASFRQDLGKYAWGFNILTQPGQTWFRRNEIDTLDGDEPFITAFAEYRPTRQTALTLGLDNLLDVRTKRFRTFFAPDRSNPNPNLFEVRERAGHVTAWLRVKQSFG
jgi:hypothetical protein